MQIGAILNPEPCEDIYLNLEDGKCTLGIAVDCLGETGFARVRLNHKQIVELVEKLLLIDLDLAKGK